MEFCRTVQCNTYEQLTFFTRVLFWHEALLCLLQIGDKHADATCPLASLPSLLFNF